jgi:CelD/BcsL family acetyltransferase involved in cellulose biosynthesis
VTTRIVTTGKEFVALRQAWGHLHAGLGATVFQSHAWLTTWWHTFGDRFSLRLFTAWDGERLLGAVCCFTLRHIFPPLRSLRFVGEYSTLGEYLPIIAAECEAEVTAAAGRFLLEELVARECDVIDFHHFPPDSRTVRHMLGSLEAAGCPVYFTPESLPRITMLPPTSAEEYHASLSYNQRAFLNRKERALASEGEAVEMLQREEVLHGYDDLVRLHTAVWTSKGEPGLFRARDCFEQFHRDVLAELVSQDLARLYFYKRDGVRFAALLVFHQHGTWCLYLSGRDPQHPLAHLSPGSLLMARAIRDAIQDGATAIDMLEGPHRYKLRLGGRLQWYARATACLAGLRGVPGRCCAALIRARDARRLRQFRKTAQLSLADRPSPHT